LAGLPVLAQAAAVTMPDTLVRRRILMPLKSSSLLPADERKNGYLAGGFFW